MSNMGYFHVLLTYDGKDEQFALRDLDEAELKDKFVKPYNRGDTFLVGSKVTAPGKVAAVRILVSSEHSKVMLEREKQRRIDADTVSNREPNGLVVLRLHNMGPDDLAGLSADVTSKYIKRADGGRPARVTKVLSHPLVAVVILGLLVVVAGAYITKKLGLTQ